MPHCLLLMCFIVGIEPIHDWHAVFILAVVTLSNVISITIGGLGVREGLAAALSPSVGLGARGRRGGVLSVVLLDQADPRYHRARVDRREYEAPFAFELKAAWLRRLRTARQETEIDGHEHQGGERQIEAGL